MKIYHSLTLITVKVLKSLTASFSIDDTSLITTGDIIEIKAVHKLKENSNIKRKSWNYKKESLITA